jgi:hypothetical protein
LEEGTSPHRKRLRNVHSSLNTKVLPVMATNQTAYAYLRDVLTRLPRMTNHQTPEVTSEA